MEEPSLVKGIGWGSSLYFGEMMSVPSEKQNIQIDNGQSILKNRTLTHHLQQSAQKTSPLSITISLETQPAISQSWEARLLSLVTAQEANQ